MCPAAAGRLAAGALVQVPIDGRAVTRGVAGMERHDRRRQTAVGIERLLPGSRRRGLPFGTSRGRLVLWLVRLVQQQASVRMNQAITPSTSW